MSLQNEIIEEVEDLIGRLSVIRVNWPDTEVRVKHSVFNLKELLSEPSPRRIYHIIDDLYDLRKYLVDIYELDEKALYHDFMPAIEMTGRLLGPTNVH